MSKRKKEDTKEDEGREFDLHVWIQPETDEMLALVTISGNGSCCGLPIDAAVEWLRELLESESEYARKSA
ncbi:MAG: hypothetical protein KGI06_06115 [Candidatus Micrarchaeota archaeon]|nr:hypothetical protein [Candidatus Micrarchaeota archaeon]